MKNHFRPNRRYQETDPQVSAELSRIEQASVQLLYSAQVSRRKELESTAEAYVRRVEQEARAESLANLLGTQARELEQLVRSTYAKENDFYYSRKGKREAIRLIADQDIRLNPGLSNDEAQSRAKRSIEQFKRVQGREVRGRKIGRVAIAPRLEMPEVCKVKGEFIGQDIYAEQFYKLEFAPLALKVNHVISDRHSPENNVSTEAYELYLPYRDVVDPLLTSSDGEAVTDSDHYFVLGLIQETASYFIARAKLSRPPATPSAPLS